MPRSNEEIITKMHEILQRIGNEVIEPNKSAIDNAKEVVRNLLTELSVETKAFTPHKFIKLLEKYLNDNIRLLYSEITVFINELYEQDDRKLQILISNLDKLYEYQTENKLSDDPELDDKLKKTIIKLWDHVNLANVQIDKLKMSDEEFNKRIAPTTSKIKEAKTTIEQTKDDVFVELSETKEEIESTKTGIYTQLISIVSIFVAISFVMFGGMSLLKNLFDYSRLERIPLIEMLCGGSLIGLIIVAVMYGFILTVIKLTNHDIGEGKKMIFRSVINRTTWVLFFILISTFLLWIFNVHSSNEFSNSYKSYQTKCKTVDYNKKTKEVTLVCPADFSDIDNKK